MKYYDISKGELVDPDTPTLGEKFSIAGMDRDLNIKTASLPYGTQGTYGAPEETPMPNWRDLIREEGVQVGPQVKMDRDLNIKTAGLAEEYYGPQKLDWMENYPDLSWEEYLRYKSSGSFNQGGRVGFQDGTDLDPAQLTASKELNLQQQYLKELMAEIKKLAKDPKYKTWQAVEKELIKKFNKPPYNISSTGRTKPFYNSRTGFNIPVSMDVYGQPYHSGVSLSDPKRIRAKLRNLIGIF